MSYFIFREMETFKDSEAIASQVYKHEDDDIFNALRAAESQLYQTMASAIANDNVKSVTCDIVNEKGDMVKFDSWAAKEEEPEPVPPEPGPDDEPEENA